MYTVYKVINLLNEKFYIGVHKTENPDDEYFGSGKAILNAIKKYGKENFKKEILFNFECKEEAYLKERELTRDFHKSNNYNMKLGGIGGFTRENSRKGMIASCSKAGKIAVEKKVGIHGLSKEQRKINSRKGGLIGGKKNGNKNFRHNELSKKQISSSLISFYSESEMSEERRKNISLQMSKIHKNKIVSEETKEKLRQKAKEAWFKRKMLDKFNE